MSSKRFNIIIFTLLVTFFFTHSGAVGCNGGCGGGSSYSSNDGDLGEPVEKPQFEAGDILEFRLEFNGENYCHYTYEVEAASKASSGQVAVAAKSGRFVLTKGYGYFINNSGVTPMNAPIVEVDGEDVIFDASDNTGASAYIVISYDKDTLKGQFTATFLEKHAEKKDAYFKGMAVNGKPIDFGELVNPNKPDKPIEPGRPIPPSSI